MNPTKSFSPMPFVLAGILLVPLVLLLSWSSLFPAKGVGKSGENGSLGIQTTMAPWFPEIPNLRARLASIGLPALPQEGNALHIHQHLDLNINGAMVPVPEGIGISEAERFISPIHVHDTTGIIHVESPTVRDFTLGQFFDIWGVRFSSTCIGGYCADATSTLKVYANGSVVTGDPRSLVLAPHQEIMIVFGTSTPPILSKYSFPANY